MRYVQYCVEKHETRTIIGSAMPVFPVQYMVPSHANVMFIQCTPLKIETMSGRHLIKKRRQIGDREYGLMILPMLWSC